MGIRRDVELVECQAELREARLELAEARRELRALRVPAVAPVRREVPVRERLVSPALARCRQQLEEVTAELAAVRAEIASLTARVPEREVLRPAELIFRPTRAVITRAVDRASAVILRATPAERRATVEIAVRDAVDDILELDVRPSLLTFERTIRDRLLDRGITVSPAVARAAAAAAFDVFGVREVEVVEPVVERRVRACPTFWTQS